MKGGRKGNRSKGNGMEKEKLLDGKQRGGGKENTRNGTVGNGKERSEGEGRGRKRGEGKNKGGKGEG